MPSKNTILPSILFGLLLVVSLCGILFGVTQSNSAESSSSQAGPPIFTSALNIVNDAGDVRATLGLWDGEHPALIMGDAQCERRTSLSVYGKERSGLTLYGQDCKRRMALEVQHDDEPTVVLRDHEGTPRVQVSLGRDGSPLVRLLDSNGKSLWEKP